MTFYFTSGFLKTTALFKILNLLDIYILSYISKIIALGVRDFFLLIWPLERPVIRQNTSLAASFKKKWHTCNYQFKRSQIGLSYISKIVYAN